MDKVSLSFEWKRVGVMVGESGDDGTGEPGEQGRIQGGRWAAYDPQSLAECTKMRHFGIKIKKKLSPDLFSLEREAPPPQTPPTCALAPPPFTNPGSALAGEWNEKSVKENDWKG